MKIGISNVLQFAVGLLAVQSGLTPHSSLDTKVQSVAMTYMQLSTLNEFADNSHKILTPPCFYKDHMGVYSWYHPCPDKDFLTNNPHVFKCHLAWIESSMGHDSDAYLMLEEVAKADNLECISLEERIVHAHTHSSIKGTLSKKSPYNQNQAFFYLNDELFRIGNLSSLNSRSLAERTDLRKFPRTACLALEFKEEGKRSISATIFGVFKERVKNLCTTLWSDFFAPKKEKFDAPIREMLPCKNCTKI